MLQDFPACIPVVVGQPFTAVQASDLKQLSSYGATKTAVQMKTSSVRDPNLAVVKA